VSKNKAVIKLNSGALASLSTSALTPTPAS